MQGWCSRGCCGKVCGSVCCTSDWNKEDLEQEEESHEDTENREAGRAAGWGPHLWGASGTCLSSLGLGGQFLCEEKMLHWLKEACLCDCQLKSRNPRTWIRHIIMHGSPLDPHVQWNEDYVRGHVFLQIVLPVHKVPVISVYLLWLE